MPGPAVALVVTGVVVMVVVLVVAAWTLRTISGTADTVARLARRLAEVEQQATQARRTLAITQEELRDARSTIDRLPTTDHATSDHA